MNTSQAPLGVASTDRAALNALVDSTWAARWKRKAGWDTDADLSRWHGVEVDAQGRVVKLTLNENNLAVMMYCCVLLGADD